MANIFENIGSVFSRKKENNPANQGGDKALEQRNPEKMKISGEQLLTNAALTDKLIELGMKIGDKESSIKNLKIELGVAGKAGYGGSEFKANIEKLIKDMESEKDILRKERELLANAYRLFELKARPEEVEMFIAQERFKVEQEEALKKETEKKDHPEKSSGLSWFNK